MAQTIILAEGVLNDDILKIASPGYHFGRGCKYLVIYYTFAGSWSNRENYFMAKTLENAIKRYQKICGRLTPEQLEDIYCCAGE